MTPSELAYQLHGTDYPVQFGPADIEGLRMHGLVVVMGESDDLLMFEGVIREEVDALGGGRALVDREGVLPQRDQLGEDDDVLLQDYFERRPNARVIEAHWSDGQGKPAWTITTDLPHATFDVIEFGEVFCRGIVFRLADIPTSQ